jgi:hypothetical protein
LTVVHVMRTQFLRSYPDAAGTGTYKNMPPQITICRVSDTASIRNGSGVVGVALANHSGHALGTAAGQRRAAKRLLRAPALSRDTLVTACSCPAASVPLTLFARYLRCSTTKHTRCEQMRMSPVSAPTKHVGSILARQDQDELIAMAGHVPAVPTLRRPGVARSVIRVFAW